MDDVPALLIVKRGPELNQKFTLSQAEITIGRSKQNAIVLTDPEVSRNHARIRRQGEIFEIEDLGSTNGTFINDQRIRIATALYNGDEVRFGDTFTLQFWHMAPDVPSDPALDIHDPIETLIDSIGINAEVDAEPGEYDSPERIESGQEVDEEFYPAVEIEGQSKGRRWLWGCGCLFFLLVFICGATIFFLDAYEGGRLLYCGPLRPLFQLILGPFGFAPSC